MRTGTSKEAAESCIEKGRQSPAASQKRRSGSLLVADTRSLARAPRARASMLVLQTWGLDIVIFLRHHGLSLRGALRVCSFSILSTFFDAICYGARGCDLLWGTRMRFAVGHADVICCGARGPQDLAEVGAKLQQEGKKRKIQDLQQFATWIVEKEAPRLQSKEQVSSALACRQ